MLIRRFLVPVVGLLAAATPVLSGESAGAWVPGTSIAMSPAATPDPGLSTSGDYATDTFSDPWDFSNAEDINTTVPIGVVAHGASMGGGVLNVNMYVASEIRLLMRWPFDPLLRWGRDGWTQPIDAGRYTQTTFSLRADQTSDMAVRYWRADGQGGQANFRVQGGPWQQIHIDLANPGSLAPGSAPWAGPIVRFELFSVTAGGLQVDWVRLHRPDAPQQPPVHVPVPMVLTPNEEGGADYATVELGNPWDFAGMDDVAETGHIASPRVEGGDLVGTTVSNDPFVRLPLGPQLNTDRYHRLTVDVCYDGQFSLADAPGGGMMGRLVWEKDHDVWTETQDFLVFPGCNKISIDLATNPPGAVHDEHSVHPTGWRGINLTSLRFDLNEDRGWRNFVLRNIKLADDAAFSTSYPITFQDVAGSAGAKADIYVTTNKGSYTGTRVAANLNVAGGVNTFNWNGNDDRGQAMPNATYWVFVVMRNGAGVGTGYSTGPVRLERPVPSVPSYFVPLTPARLLDTRTGEGGNISPLGQGVLTELDVTGVGGVPEGAGVTAVVMNVTVADPTAAGFITAWPSGEPRPWASNVNYVPGQVVPNLVTVKIGGNGKVNLFNSAGNSHVVADVVGYYSPNAPGGRFTALTPARLLDTRSGLGAPAAAVGPGQTINLGVTGVGGVPPTGVSGVAINVTVDQPTGSGFLTVWPAGEGRPNASTHNFVPGLTVANLVLAKVGANGQISIFNSSGNTHVVADVIGYFSSSGGAFVPVAPHRLVDTRDGTGGTSGPLGAGERRTMNVTAGPVPAGAKAVIVNVTSTNSTLPSYVTVWPTAAQQPLASTLNPRPWVAVPNQAYLRVGGGGSLDVFNLAGSTDVVIDVFGYVM